MNTESTKPYQFFSEVVKSIDTQSRKIYPPCLVNLYCSKVILAINTHGAKYSSEIRHVNMSIYEYCFLVKTWFNLTILKMKAQTRHMNMA